MSLFAKISTGLDARSARLAGIGLMLLSIFMFSFGDALGKYMVATYSVGPIFVTALSAIVLREPVGWRRWSAVLIGFCGVLIALRPSSQTISGPALIALAGSMT